ncbi:MAG: tRNA (N6-threonylcarbamoyladenosine(37)-N6)-methyltransferase TrmO, partial [Bdellovibrionia bacterium]
MEIGLVDMEVVMPVPIPTNISLGMKEPYQFEAIGFLTTCFKEKFGIPRQPRLVTGADGILKLKNNPFLKTAVRELDKFSHIWIVFLFHQHDAKNWKPSIRPPRLRGAKKVGVLASRSPHRPNPIGLSAVKLERIDFDSPGGVELHLSGVDFLDGTPVLDIKPYIPYADSIPEASAGWADEVIKRTPVEFTDVAEASIARLSGEKYPRLRELIVGMLELDPRPASQQRKLPSDGLGSQGTRHGFRLFEFDVKWMIRDGSFLVFDLEL